MCVSSSLRRVPANTASKSLISDLDSKTNGLPERRGGAGKSRLVSEPDPWAGGLECAGCEAKAPVGESRVLAWDVRNVF